MLSKLKSRKLWAAVAGATVLALGGQLGIPESVTAKIALILGAYIGGEALADAAGALAKK